MSDRRRGGAATVPRDRCRGRKGTAVAEEREDPDPVLLAAHLLEDLQANGRGGLDLELLRQACREPGLPAVVVVGTASRSRSTAPPGEKL